MRWLLPSTPGISTLIVSRMLPTPLFDMECGWQWLDTRLQAFASASEGAATLPLPLAEGASA